MKNAIFAFLMIIGFPASAQAAEADRVALIVANAAYTNANILRNPTRDARAVERTLQSVGFKVTVVNNANLDSFKAGLQEFSRSAKGAQVALFYFAGHGMEDSQRRNWLLPIDARLESPGDVPYEAVDLDLALAALEGAQIRVAVLDACRNNPLGRSWPASHRAANGRGLGRIEVDDVLVLYSAAPGQVALDGDGEISPFAQAFKENIARPGIPIQMAGGLIRDKVLTLTHNEQRPFISASITGVPYYLGPAVTSPMVVPFSNTSDTLLPNIQRFDGTTSSFIRQAGEVWHEIDRGRTIFTFKEFARDAEFVTLFDASRNTLVRLPVRGGQALWSYQNPIRWTPFLIVNAGR